MIIQSISDYLDLIGADGSDCAALVARGSVPAETLLGFARRAVAKADITRPWPWFAEEFLVTRILSGAWNAATRDLQKELLRAASADKLDAVVLDSVAERMVHAIDALPHTVHAKLATTIEAVQDKAARAFTRMKGRIKKASTEELDDAWRRWIAESTANQTEQFLTAYPHRVLPGEIRRIIAILEASPEQEAARRDFIRDRLRRVTDGSWYWGKLSAVQTATVWHAEGIRIADNYGIGTYTIVNPLDALTCPVCQILHGTVYSVEESRQAIEQRQSIMDPVLLTKTFPFPRLKDVERVPTAELQKMGFRLPPFHPHCRDSIQYTSLAKKPKDDKRQAGRAVPPDIPQTASEGLMGWTGALVGLSAVAAAALIARRWTAIQTARKLVLNQSSRAASVLASVDDVQVGYRQTLPSVHVDLKAALSQPDSADWDRIAVYADLFTRESVPSAKTAAALHKAEAAQLRLSAKAPISPEAWGVTEAHAERVKVLLPGQRIKEFRVVPKEKTPELVDSKLGFGGWSVEDKPRRGWSKLDDALAEARRKDMNVAEVYISPRKDTVVPGRMVDGEARADILRREISRNQLSRVYDKRGSVIEDFSTTIPEERVIKFRMENHRDAYQVHQKAFADSSKIELLQSAAEDSKFAAIRASLVGKGSWSESMVGPGATNLKAAVFGTEYSGAGIRVPFPGGTAPFATMADARRYLKTVEHKIDKKDYVEFRALTQEYLKKSGFPERTMVYMSIPGEAGKATIDSIKDYFSGKPRARSFKLRTDVVGEWTTDQNLARSISRQTGGVTVAIPINREDVVVASDLFTALGAVPNSLLVRHRTKFLHIRRQDIDFG